MFSQSLLLVVAKIAVEAKNRLCIPGKCEPEKFRLEKIGFSKIKEKVFDVT